MGEHPSRFSWTARLRALTLDRVTRFVKRRKKTLLIVVLVVGSFLVYNIASVMAFKQTVEVNGVRIETDKEVYQIGETVKINVYILNKLDFPIGGCGTNILTQITGPLGKAYQAMTFNLCVGTIDLSPGTEMGGEFDNWKASLVPGTYTIRVVIYAIVGVEKSFLPFTGSTTILVIV